VIQCVLPEIECCTFVRGTLLKDRAMRGGKKEKKKKKQKKTKKKRKEKFFLTETV
jgi:hypothetical protein